MCYHFLQQPRQHRKSETSSLELAQEIIGQRSEGNLGLSIPPYILFRLYSVPKRLQSLIDSRWIELVPHVKRSTQS